MTTHTRLRWGAVVFVALVVLLLGGAHLCGVAQDPGSRPLSTGALACLEFWLNRYQTLLGAAAALVAAGIAWIGVSRQIEKTDKQLAIANRQTAISLLGALDARIGSTIQLQFGAEEVANIIILLRNMARDAFGNANLLGGHYKKGMNIPGANEGLAADVVEYTNNINILDEKIGQFAAEWRRGLVDLETWKNCQIIYTSSTMICHNHRKRLRFLQKCANIDYSKEPIEFEMALAATGKFEEDEFIIAPDYFDIPLRKLSSDVNAMYQERERCLKQCRT